MVGLKITNTLHNTEYPLHLKPAAQPHLKAEVQVYDHMLGPKNKQHKKIKQFNQNRGRSSGTSIGAKTFNTWILKNDVVH